MHVALVTCDRGDALVGRRCPRRADRDVPAPDLRGAVLDLLRVARQRDRRGRRLPGHLVPGHGDVVRRPCPRRMTRRSSSASAGSVAIRRGRPSPSPAAIFLVAWREARQVGGRPDLHHGGATRGVARRPRRSAGRRHRLVQSGRLTVEIHRDDCLVRSSSGLAARGRSMLSGRRNIGEQGVTPQWTITFASTSRPGDDMVVASSPGAPSATARMERAAGDERRARASASR